uniref:Uncharacterized protein n=1 Tax=Panagrolaimus davidi TaxID=227884 RepID=A0A914PKX7_9BILA
MRRILGIGIFGTERYAIDSVEKYYNETGFLYSLSWQERSDQGIQYATLTIHPDQLDMLSYYPKLLKALIPILDIPPSTKVSRSQYDAVVENPLILHQLLYYKKQNIQSQEPKQIAFFGGAFNVYQK